MYDSSSGSGTDETMSNSKNTPRNSENMMDGRAGTSGTEENEIMKEKKNDLNDILTFFSGLYHHDDSFRDPINLCGGRAFAEILQLVDQDHFHNDWLEKISSFKSTNVVMKRSNLRKLWRKIEDYVIQLNRRVKSKRWERIHDRVDGIEETDLLVALDFAMIIVTLAHLGKNRDDFINYSKHFLLQNEAAMKNIARIVENVMNEIPERDFEDFDDDRKSNFDESETELNISLSDTSFRTNGAGRISISDGVEIEAWHVERVKLMKEIEKLKNQLENSQKREEAAAPDFVMILEKKNEEMKKKNREMSEKVEMLEGQLDKMSETVEALVVENDELKILQNKNQSLEKDLQSTRDQMEIWQVKAEKLTIDSEVLKRREKENLELQGQVKLLQSRIDHHVRESSNEEDLKSGMSSMRQTIGSLNSDIKKLEIEKLSKELIVKKLEKDLIGYKEDVKCLKDANEQLNYETKTLKEKLSRMSEKKTERSLHDSFLDSENLSFEMSDKQPSISLELENQLLIEKIQELEGMEQYKGEVLILKNQLNAIEQECEVAKKQRDDSIKQVEELEKKLENSEKNGNSEVVELKIELEKMLLDEQKARESAERAQKKMSEMEKKMEENEKKCTAFELALNKAKTIIDELEQNCRQVGEESGTSVQQFKQLQLEKDQLIKRVEALEAELNTVTTTYEQENRLLTSATNQMVLDRNVDAMLSTFERRAEAGKDCGMASSSSSTSTSTPTPTSSTMTKQRMTNAISWSVPLLLISVLVICKVLSILQAPPEA